MLVFYYNIVLMSIVATLLYLFLKLLSKGTQKYFAATWHYFSYALLYTLFFVPYFKLFNLLNWKISIPVLNTSERHYPITPIKDEIPGSSISVSLKDKSRFDATGTIYHETGQDILDQLGYIAPFALVIGTLVFLSVILIRNIKVYRRIFSVCELTDDLNILNALSYSKEKLGITKDISIHVSPYAISPFLYGMFKPRIILPATMNFNAEEYRHIFLHELTHYKRWDVWVKFLFLCVNALHWFNPFVYMARRDIDRFCELSCDEQIVKHMNTAERGRYCQLILNVLWHVVDQKGKFHTAFGDKRKYLERRIKMILKKDSAKRIKSIRLFSIVTTLILVVVGATAVYAGSINNEVKSEWEVVNKEGCLLKSQEIGKGAPVMGVTSNKELALHVPDNTLNPGDCKSYGSMGLHQGNVLSVESSYVGGDLELYLINDEDITLDEGKLIKSGSDYIIPEDGNYYYLLINRSKNVASEHIKINVTVLTRND